MRRFRQKSRKARRSGDSVRYDREQAYEFLFHEETIALVWRWLYRLAVPLVDREDVLQNVFLAAHASFHTYNPDRGVPERWLNKIVVYTSAHYHDRAYHRREDLMSDEEFELFEDDHPGADEQIEAEQERLLVLELLQQLDVESCSIIIARDIDGLSMAEIAEEYGIPVSTAYKLRSRAMATFKGIVEKHRREERQREERR